MIDREYIKLNTSIQTASNRSDLVPDENGNYPAVIELNLPNNIFKAKDGAKKVDKVSMLTTKMRMSMSETPIAQIPMDDTVDIPGVLTSKCQFDVYPFALLDNERLQPESIDETVFPKYKKHIITYKFVAYLEDLTNFVELETISLIANNNETFPETSRFYQILEENNAFVKNMDHLMNLCISSARRVTREQNSSSILVNDIGTIEQMLEDGLENAITYASTQTETIVTISLVNPSLDFSSLTEDLPNLDSTVYLNDYGITVCFWKSEQESGDNNSTSLISACKPKFSFDAQTMSLSYDSAPFSENVPVVWNQSYVNTFERPEQLEIDTLREDMWVSPPPPKRMYQYDVTTSNDPPSYNFAINSQTNCGVMNLIGNKMMKETFSFLPWIKVDLSKISQISGLPNYQYGVEYTRETTRNKVGEGITSTSWHIANNASNYHHYSYITDADYSEDVVWYVFQYDTMGASVQQTNTTTYFCYPQDRYSFDESNIRLVSLNDLHAFQEGAIDLNYSTYTSYDEPILVSSDTSVYEQYTTNVNMQGSLGTEVISSREDIVPGQIQSSSLPLIYYYYPNNRSYYGYAICWLARGNGIPVEFHQYAGNLSYRTYNSSAFNGGLSFGGFVPNVAYDFELETQPEEGVTRHFRVWVLNAPLWNIDGIDSQPHRTFITFVNSNRGAILEKNVSSGYVDTTVLSKTTTAMSSIPKYEFIPNLDLENETTFYMLDCISSKVKVGEQEVIEVPQNSIVDDDDDDDEDELYRVRQVTSTWTETDNSDLQWEDNPYASGDPSAGEFNFYTQGFTPSLRSAMQMVMDSSWNYENLTILQYIFWRSTDDLSKIHYIALIADDNQTGGAEANIQPVNSYNLTEQNLQVLNTTHTTSDVTRSLNRFITTENISPGSQTTVLNQEITDGTISRVASPTQQYHFNLRKYTQGSSEPITSLPGIYLDPSKFELCPTKEELPFANDPFLDDLTYYKPIPLLSELFQGTGIDATGIKELREYAPAIFNLDQDSFPNPWDPSLTYLTGSDSVAFRVPAFSDEETYEGTIYYFTLHTDIPPSDTSDPTAIWPHSFTYSCSGGTYKRRQDVVTTKQTATTTSVTPINHPPTISDYIGNVRLNFTWDNLPTVILSPITSFVLTLAGARVSDEIQPVNVADNALGSAQLSTIPIIENYYSTASTLRDLHDELIVIRDQVTNAATYTLANTGGEERTLKFAVKYITKDGKLHQVYIPPNGVFTLQLTFILDLVSI